MTTRKNEIQKSMHLFHFLKANRVYTKRWQVHKQNNPYIQSILEKTSKKNTGNCGYPDLIYANEDKRLLILIESKDSVKDHVSKHVDQPTKFAVDGVKHYLSFFTEAHIKKAPITTQTYLNFWKIIGIAFSGDIEDEYNHQIDTFIIKNDTILDIEKKEILDEADYIALFENIDLEEIASDISRSSSEINRLLRNLDSQKRPILLSALMICLYPQKDGEDFKNSYGSWSTKNIIRNIPTTIHDILSSEGINEEKINILTNELSFIKTDHDLNTTDILKDILRELEDKVIPLFDKKTSYDIIGKFYEEFLRYAGITNVKKGIVLTPNHIATLFTELIDIKTNDVIFDPACGTGAFLIAGMNKLVDIIEKSPLQDKKRRIKHIKEKQLIGYEKSSTMYALVISNMLFRGDGKSQIFNEDFFSKKADNTLKGCCDQPTIGFINPPYGGKSNKKNPTQKEIQFLEKMLDNCSRFGIMIAPLSTYFKDEIDRDRILTKHTLKCVINMPNELFQPNASTHTAIAVFETNKPHSKHDQVTFYDLKDDGLVLSKNKGRTDALNKWKVIKKDMLNRLRAPKKHSDSACLVHKKITGNDEWIIQAHAGTDYTHLSSKIFIKTVKEYAIFYAKLRLNLIEKKLDDVALLDIFNSHFLDSGAILNQSIALDKQTFQEFPLYASYSGLGLFQVRGCKKSYIRNEVFPGEYLYVTTSNKNNGITCTSNLYTEDGNVITIDSATDGKAFYQASKFIGSDHVEVLEPVNFRLNKYNALFISTVLNLQLPKYGFGRKRSQKRIKQESVFLPTNKRGNPDWPFMEGYIKSLPYSKSLEHSA